MKTHFDLHFLENATETMRAIAHPARLAIVDLLSRNEELSVTEIYEQLDLEQAVASHHLRILKNKDVVRVKRDGKNSLYALTKPEYAGFLDILTKVL
ncbi:MAG: helix-turn-helix transcriptional regulator [Bacteroidetes bacterium]|nr:helix-turn-helix transcriptional regulator [Bacteroidota bacterium]